MIKNTKFGTQRITHHKSNKNKIIILILFSTNLLLFGTVWYLGSVKSLVISGGIAGSETKIDSFKEYQKTLISPSPNSPEAPYGAETNGVVRFKIENYKTGRDNWPDIKARNAIVVDIKNKKILFKKNMEERVPVASLVKIMTAVVALEHAKPDKIITVTKRAAETPENFMGISAGEKYTLEDLLYGLLLPSGNDAAEAIADGVAFDRNVFVDWMNIKAAELGLKNTKFVNPSGLNNESELEYSTAYDLAILTHYALKNHPIFAKIVSTFAYTIPYSKDHKYLYFENQTNLLTSYPGVKGVKTGYTEEAGLSLVTYAENPISPTPAGDADPDQTQKIIGIVLGSSDRRGDMVRLLDRSFEYLGVDIEHNFR